VTLASALDALNRAKGWLLALIFFGALIVGFWAKVDAILRVADEIAGLRESVDSLRVETTRQARADSAIDYAFRDALCRELGVRNDQCIHFPQGVRVMLVAPDGAAIEEGPP
jgi:hypothetical protein